MGYARNNFKYSWYSGNNAFASVCQLYIICRAKMLSKHCLVLVDSSEGASSIFGWQKVSHNCRTKWTGTCDCAHQAEICASTAPGDEPDFNNHNCNTVIWSCARLCSYSVYRKYRIKNPGRLIVKRSKGGRLFQTVISRGFSIRFEWYLRMYARSFLLTALTV